MAASEKDLELQLMEAGNRLVDPPSSVDELIPLLDQVESCLSRVEQSPSQSMQNALSPSLKALVAEQLFRHPDDDVKVAVAACISEITRITAPDAPYEDDQMREVFQLIVSSFENLSDKSSRSFIKRTSILETVAKVRSCVVMLDLECDDLIVEMFQHFLKAIRDYHPEAVFTSMVTIMSLVLEESEDIPTKLLSPLLTSVKKDNEEVLPVARSLAEKVLENCASKLLPYLTQAVENLGISYGDYSRVLASVCRATASVVEQKDAATEKHVDDESILVEAPSEKAAQEDKQIPEEAVKTEQVDLANGKSPNTVVCNGIMRTAEEDSLADLNSIKMKEGNHIADESKNDKSTVAETDISKAEEVVNSDTKLEQSTQEKKKESDFKLNELSDSSHVDEKAVETLKDHKKDSKDDAGSAREVLSVDGVVSSENRRETDVPHSSQKAAEEESADVPHSSQKATEEELTDVLHSSQKATEEESTDVLHSSQKATEEESTDVPHSSQKATEEESTDVPHSSQKATEDESTDVSHSTRAPRSKRKESVRKETTSSVDGVSKKAYEATSDSEKKTNRRARKKVSTVVSNEDNAPDGVDETKKENDTANDSEAKSLKKSSKKVDSSSNNADETMKEGDIGSDSEVKSLKSSKKVDSSGNNADESISRQLTDSKRRARGKVVPEKDRAKTSTENDEEEVVGSQDSHMEETPKANSKRKHTLSKEKASDSMEYGENLVGLKVKVWWPADREFYVGFIHSFDPSKKKHKVNYIDGDQEILNLKREKWVVIEDESGSDEEGVDNHPSPDGSSDMPQRKKAKTPDLLSKKTKTDASPKSGGGTSTGKSKGAAMKSGRKTKDEAKMDGKSKDGSKSASKSDNDSVAKSKDHTPKTGSKSFDIASKASNKSKNEDSGDTPKSTKSKDDRSATPKASTKLKQDALKTAKSKQETSNVSPLSKGKPPRSGGKSNDKGTVKSKSDSSKVKESESTKEKSTDSGKLVGSAKRKASSLSKAHGSDSKSGKKGRR